MGDTAGGDELHGGENGGSGHVDMKPSAEYLLGLGYGGGGGGGSGLSRKDGVSAGSTSAPSSAALTAYPPPAESPANTGMPHIYIYIYFFFCLRDKGFFSLSSDFLHYDTTILQRIRIIVGDARFEPGTSAPEVWCAIPMSNHISKCATAPFLCHLPLQYFPSCDPQILISILQ